MSTIAACLLPARSLPSHVLFCCTANRIRSVFAQRAATQLNLIPTALRSHPIESCGILARTGQPATSSAIAAARRLGVDLGGHRSRSAKNVILKDAWLLCMTQDHCSALTTTSTWRAELLGDYGGQGDMPDPVGLDEAAHIKVFERILHSLHVWSQQPLPDAPAPS